MQEEFLQSAGIDTHSAKHMMAKHRSSITLLCKALKLVEAEHHDWSAIGTFRDSPKSDPQASLIRSGVPSSTKPANRFVEAFNLCKVQSWPLFQGDCLR